MSHVRPAVLMLITCAGLATWPPSAVMAQNAIGAGNALDANLDPRYRGINAPAPRQDFQSRNNIVTDTVLGGRGFRGSVGYTDPFTFRGQAGSEDTYSFRAGSAWSSVNFINYGSTYQKLRFGQEAALLQYPRLGDKTPEALADSPGASSNQVVESRLRLDRLSQASTLVSRSALEVEPSILGGFVDEEGRTQLLETSSATGVVQLPVEQNTQAMGLSSFDKARLFEDLMEGRVQDLGGLGKSYKFDYRDLDLPLPGEAEVDDEQDETSRKLEPRVDSRLESSQIVRDPERSLRDIRSSVAQRFAERLARTGQHVEGLDEEELKTQIEEDIARLRSRLAGMEDPNRNPVREPIDPDAATGGPGAREDTPPPPLSGLERFSDPTRVEPEEEPLPPGQLPPPAKLEDFGVILRHGQRVEQFSTDDGTRFNELMRTAEERLRKGEYFWAERRFNRALRFTPGHPLATAGLAHAQIGAGLDLSAAITLRSLFNFQPEMIDVRYDEGLLPNQPRLRRSIGNLEPRLAPGRRDRSHFAFLYAYLGRLIDDRAVIEHGLDVMQEADPEDALPPLLRSVWLAPGSAAPDPSK